MLGRATILQKMVGALTKAIPDHLQVVGPRFAGKTVIVHELAARLRVIGSPYSAVLVWDLGHQTPGTDALFMQGLARQLSAALKDSHPDYAEHLRSPLDNPYQDMAEVLDLLKDEGAKVLAIMDGFDKPLSNGQLTRNLWDQLRELALKSSLRLVTASRCTLRDLIRHPDAQTSDFWNIFDPTPVRVGCFDENDLTTVLATMPERPLTAGAQTELWNASNGFPVLVLGVLNAVYETGTAGAVSPEAMRTACEEAFPTVRDELDALWIDCPPPCQDLMRRVLDEGSVARAGIAPAHLETLIECGFIHTAANKLQRPSRLLARYLGEDSNESNAIVRLFGDQGAYLVNMRGVLERRIAQIDGLDKELRRYLTLGVAELPGFPKVFFSNIRGIVDRALEMIWEAEFHRKRIPSEWISVWRFNGENKAGEWLSRFPRGGERLRLLDLMTGTQKCDLCAKYVTKSTYVLANAVQGFGDFGQHQEGAPIDPGTAYSGLHLCIELAAAVTRELPRPLIGSTSVFYSERSN
jgi:hypothetical protein